MDYKSDALPVKLMGQAYRPLRKPVNFAIIKCLYLFQATYTEAVRV